MDLDAGARHRRGRVVLAGWYVAYLSTVIVLHFWYFESLSTPMTAELCKPGELDCNGSGRGRLATFVMVLFLLFLAACLMISWVLLLATRRMAWPGAVAGTVAGLGGPLLIVLAGWLLPRL